MKFLSLAALKVGLKDLFEERHAALVLTNAGKAYEPMLQQKRTQIEALPAVLTGGKPLAEEIGNTDAVHDGFGAALWHICQGYLRWPNIPPEVKEAVKRVLAAFIPQLDDLQASYTVEIDAAIRHKSDLVKLVDDLKLIPIAGGLTLFDLAQGYVDAGLLMGTKLSERADADTGARSEAAKIRSNTVAMLGRLRAALQDELEADPTLPKDLDGQVFAYFDQLDAMRAAAVAAAKAAKGAKKGPEGAPPTPPTAPPGTPPADGTP